MKRPFARRLKQGGFTFLELSFVLILFGIIVAMLAQVIPAMRRASATAETVRNLTNVENSLVSFAAINGRLPCADTNDDGIENASPCAVVGKLPFVTLGFSGPLVNADGYDFKYALYYHPANADATIPLRTDATLGDKKERYQPSIGTGTPVTLTQKSFTTSNRRLDFCQGLRAGMDASIEANYLYIETPAGARKNVAYALVDPGVGDMDLNGDLFDGFNSSATAASPKFEHPGRSQSAIYDDRVIVAYFDQFWDKLGCSANMATAGRALPNVETMLALFEQTAVDYKTQLDIAVDIAFADNFSAGAGVAAATTGLLSSGAAMATDIASAINTMGVTSGAAVSAGIAIGLNTAALGVAIANTVLTALNLQHFKDYRDEFQTLRTQKLDPLYSSVQFTVQSGGANVFSDE
jgi:type II secretory pathway pseudopilin PulG